MKRLCVLGLLGLFAGACSFSGGSATAGDGDGDGDGDRGVDAGAAADAQSSPDAADSPDASSAVADIVVQKTNTPPSVTTFDAAEWSSIPRQSINFSSATNHKHVDDGYSEDAAAVFGAVHDNTHIYLIVEVTDDEAFALDRIEVYFDTGGDMSGVYGSDDSYVTIDREAQWSSNSTSIMLEGSLIPGSDGDLTYAIRFPKSNLGAGVSDGLVGFNVSLWDADNDEGEGGWVLWREPEGPHCDSCCASYDHGEPWCDTTMLGEMLLAP